jgi:hypothetical protein
MKIHLTLFNTKSNYGQEGYYDKSIQVLIDSFKNNGVDYVHHYTEDNVPWGDDLKPYFETYKRNGYGFWAFKPLIILDVMNKIDDGDVVIYHDAGRPEYKFEVKNSIVPLVNIVKNHYQGIGLCEGPWSHNQYTKDKCFKMMDCDTPYIRQKNQLAASIGIYEKNPKSLLFLNDWKKWCLTHQAICTEEPGDFKHDNFQAHRHDQSISSLLISKMGNKLIRGLSTFCFLECCLNKKYNFIDPNQPPSKYKYRYDHINQKIIGSERN